MKSSGCLALVLLFHLSGALGNQDYHYCGHTWMSQTFHEEVGINGILVTNPRRNNHRGYNYHKQQNFASGLLLTDSTSVITMARPEVTGTFVDSPPKLIDHSGFCDLTAGNDKLYSADLDGNGQDDLLCHKLDGTFVAKMSSNSNYKRPSPVAKGFNCPFATHAVHLGDFDGNGAADILCAANNRLSYTIYFNFDSYSHFHPYGQDNHFSRKGRYDHLHNSHMRYKGHTHKMPTLPMAYSLVAPFPCAAATAVIIVADVNGDKRDDIVCHDGTTVTYHLSNDKPSPTILASGSVSATALATCDTASQTLLAADVDCDGDDDLVCLTTDVSLNLADQVLIAYSTGEYATEFAADPTCVPFCRGVPGSTLAQFGVGDFNGDGKEDILCRYLDPTGPTTWFTSIIFAERKP